MPLDKRDEIIEAARSVFLKYGFRKTTLDDLATAAGMTKSSLYHYFRGKEDLFREVVRTVHLQAMANHHRALAQRDDIQGKLDVLVASMKNQHDEYKPHMTALMGEITDVFPAVKDVVGEHFEQMLDMVEGLLLDAVDRGELSPLPAREIAAMLLIVFSESFKLDDEFTLFRDISSHPSKYFNTLLAPYMTKAGV